MISIIIRTYNEERWISLCLEAVFKQEYKDFEVIVVDNRSTDMTVSKAAQYGVKVVNIDDYKPGKALNAGIRASGGEYICCLSGHCIPVDEKWLENLLRNFDDKSVAGVYGRQEPMAFTSDFDKRDLLNVFGLDKKVQVKDSFFHNANSMIRRDIWEKIPFDEQLTNIEDRVWAKEALNAGYKIIYDPDAGVYHYHGIHQDNDEKRCANVVRILESLELSSSNKLDASRYNSLAIIPIKGDVQYLGGRPLFEYTIERCKQSKFVKRVIVSTDNPEVADMARKSGAESPFLRDKDLSAEHVDIERVLQFSLGEIEKLNIYPDIVVILEATYPFRSPVLIDKMVQALVEKGLDSVIPVRKEFKACWMNAESELKRVDQGFMPRALKDPLYIGLTGLGCVSLPVFLREGRRLGDKVGFIEIDDPYSGIEVRSKEDLLLAERIINQWWPANS